MNNSVLLFFLSILVVTVNSAKILAWFPVPSISHQVVFRPVTQELAKRGHEVVVITPDPAFPPGQAPPNLTEIDLHDKSYNIWRELILSSKLTTGSADDLPTQIYSFISLLTDIFEMQYNEKEVQNLLGNKTHDFDLIIAEAASRQALALTQFKKVPVIMFSSLGGYGDLYDLMGAPSKPSLLYPTMLSQKINDLSLFDKLCELKKYFHFEYLIQQTLQNDVKMLKKYFGNDVEYRNLYENVDLLFLNTYPIWEFNRPVPPGIVYLGGLHQKPGNDLTKVTDSEDKVQNSIYTVLVPICLSEKIGQVRAVLATLMVPYTLKSKEWKSYLDSSKNGVIYVSFGTNVSPSHLPPERIQLLVKVLSQLPYDILWKWDKDELPGRTANIKIAKWLPQSDLLRHPKVKAFVTQCGLQSTDEAITAGVPLIGMPMLGDQWYNAEMYEKHKIGIRADLSGLTEEKLKKIIDKVVNDDSYRKNIEKLRNIMQDQPQTPLERAVWWTEYVIRHGGAKHLRAPAANMTWADYLDLELLAAIAGIVLTAVSLIVLAIYLVVKFIKNTLFPAKKLKKS